MKKDGSSSTLGGFETETQNTGWTSNYGRGDSASASSGPRRRTSKAVPKFAGSGPGGSLQRDDMKVWSRAMHRSPPPDCFRHVRIPYRTIFMVSESSQIVKISFSNP